MQLTLFNGSPRGKGSNTKVLLEQFTRGFTEVPNNHVQVAYLNNVQKLADHVALFKQSENMIVAFPLYTDAMPGIVKHFIEALAPLCGQCENLRLGFIVQSGFPEPAHSRPVEKYLRKLTTRLGCHLTGVVIRGGAEGIRMQPPWMTKKLFRNFYELGRHYGQTAQFDETILKKLAPREKLSDGRKLFFRLANLVGFANFHWNMQLKKNNAFDQRFNQPYLSRDQQNE